MHKHHCEAVGQIKKSPFNLILFMKQLWEKIKQNLTWPHN